MIESWGGGVTPSHHVIIGADIVVLLRTFQQGQRIYREAITLIPTKTDAGPA